MSKEARIKDNLARQVDQAQVIGDAFADGFMHAFESMTTGFPKSCASVAAMHVHDSIMIEGDGKP